MAKIIYTGTAFETTWQGIRFVQGEGVDVDPLTPDGLFMVMKAKGNRFFDVVDADMPSEPVTEAVSEPEAPADYVPVDDDKERLRTLLRDRGVDVDGRWGLKRLQTEWAAING